MPLPRPRCSIRVISALLATLLILPSPATAAIINNLEFQQLTFVPVDPERPVQSLTDVGRVMVLYDKDPEPGYLNISAAIPGLTPEPQWIVRNFIMTDMTMGPPQEEVAYNFPLSVLGMEPGMPCPEIQYGFSLNPFPFSDEEGAAWALTAPLDQMALPLEMSVERPRGVTLMDSTVVDSIPTEPDFWYTHFLAPGLTLNETMIGCQMHNMPLDSTARANDWNGCVPASCTNSLHWLKDQNSNVDFPGDENQTFRELSNLMNRLHKQGVSTTDMVRAKLDFIEAHNLPIQVKFQNYFHDGNITSSSGYSTAGDSLAGPVHTLPTKDWLFSEARDKEDVEVIFGYWYQAADGSWHRDGGHAVALSGTGMVLDQPVIHIKHDNSQSTPGGNVQEQIPVYVTPDGGMILIGKGGKWKHGTTGPEYQHHAVVDGVVSESPKEGGVPGPPAIEHLTRYCQEFTRVIPPGKSLYLNFPDVWFRCLNMTIYTWDREHEPLYMYKTGEWNNNDNEVRELANPGPLPMTVTIHNDDWAPSWMYSSWDVGVSIGPSSPDKATSPFNPEVWGGFSVGFSDTSGDEFGDITAPVVQVDAGAGCNLGDIPRRLSALPGSGVQQLELYEMVPAWNPYWEQLALVVDVAEVTSPGDLLVTILNSGEQILIPVPTVGRYEQVLQMNLPMGPEVRAIIQPQNGLDMVLDCFGMPSVAGLSDTPDASDIPRQPVLASISPNPFNPTTVIRFGVPVDGPAVLDVYDIRGRRIATLFEGRLTAGYHEEIWRGMDDGGRPVSAGTYIARLKVGRNIATAKMVVVR